MSNAATLVLGSSGIVGRRVAAQLGTAGVPLRTGSRRGDPPFEWTEPDTWTSHLAGTERLFLMSPEGVPIHPRFVETAVEAGVIRIVLLSDRGLEVMEVDRLIAAEAMVRASPVTWTIIRPDWFNQDFDESFLAPGILAGLVTVPIGEVKQGFVDADDIAAVIVRALLDDGHAGRTYELTGPTALSFAQAVGIIAEHSGRAVHFAGDPASFRRGQELLGVPAGQIDTDLGHFAALAARGDVRPTDDVQRVTGRPARSFAEFARRAAASGAWEARNTVAPTVRSPPPEPA